VGLIDRSSDGPDLRSSVEIVCRHAWLKHRHEGGCPCMFMRCEDCGVIRKTFLCPLHKGQTQDKRSSREYYHEAFDDGVPQNATYALELASALREMDAPPLPRGGSLLEVGCGIGRLVPWFLHGGLRYTAVETDPWAGRYVREAYQVPVETRPWEDVPIEPQAFDVVASLHFLEHVTEADVAFEKMVMAARRYVLLVVPEGWDIWNADHWWMFTQDVLRVWARNLGLRLYGPVQKTVVAREDTIYAVFERTPA